MNIPLFDAHCDTIFRARRDSQRIASNTMHTDLERGMTFSPYAQVFALWSMPEEQPKEDYAHLLALMQEEFSANADILTHCRSAQDARQAASEGKIAAFVSVEGGEQIGCSIEGLRTAYDNGIRIVNPVWNSDNAICGAALGEKGSGLTEYGRTFVREAQSLGVALDMSHISPQAFWDILEISTRPIIASHSNSIALCPHPRNLTDDQFVALVKSGGAVGINLCPDFLGLSRDIAAIVAHIEHFLALGGSKTVCIGGDLDGIEDLPDGITGIQDMEKVYDALLSRNHSESLVHDIFYNNFLEVLSAAI